GASDRRAELGLGDLHGQLRTFDEAFDRRSRHLAVALCAVPIARREVRAVDADREIERRTADELLAIDVPAVRAGRSCRVDPRLVRRHADDAEEGGKPDTSAAVVDGGIALQSPADTLSMAERLAEGSRPHDVDVNDQRLALRRGANVDRADERMARVELLVARLERLLRYRGANRRSGTRMRRR